MKEYTVKVMMPEGERCASIEGACPFMHELDDDTQSIWCTFGVEGHPVGRMLGKEYFKLPNCPAKEVKHG